MDKRTLFVQVFRENNGAVRTKFFSDPVVKYVWDNIFVTQSEDIIISHLRRIRSHPDFGEQKYIRLLKDMNDNEVNYNFRMLPDAARDMN